MIMSLLRLLTAGRSLVNIGDTETRYRLTSQRLLPQFGSGKNPFSGREAATAMPASAAEPSPEPTAVPANGESPSRAKALWLRAAARMSGWTEKLSGRFARPNVKPTKPAVPQFSKPAVQGELSLDQVRVIRNDLSDADLEIVTARKKAAPAAVAGEPARGGEGTLGRVTARLLGAGKM
jgi:hypothetical protein